VGDNGSMVVAAFGNVGVDTIDGGVRKKMMHWCLAASSGATLG